MVQTQQESAAIRQHMFHYLSKVDDLNSIRVKEIRRYLESEMGVERGAFKDDSYKFMITTFANDFRNAEQPSHRDEAQKSKKDHKKDKKQHKHAMSVDETAATTGSALSAADKVEKVRIRAPDAPDEALVLSASQPIQLTAWTSGQGSTDHSNKKARLNQHHQQSPKRSQHFSQGIMVVDEATASLLTSPTAQELANVAAADDKDSKKGKFSYTETNLLRIELERYVAERGLSITDLSSFFADNIVEFKSRRAHTELWRQLKEVFPNRSQIAIYQRAQRIILSSSTEIKTGPFTEEEKKQIIQLVYIFMFLFLALHFLGK
jgi:hypothetical protein